MVSHSGLPHEEKYPCLGNFLQTRIQSPAGRIFRSQRQASGLRGLQPEAAGIFCHRWRRAGARPGGFGPDYEHHQHIWLPLFAGLTALFTILGIAGALVLWFSRQFAARRLLLLVALAIFLRLALFSSIENPEPRYLVELFPFLAILGGVALTHLYRSLFMV